MSPVMPDDERQGFLAGIHVGIFSLAQDSQAPLSLPAWYAYTPGEDLRVLLTPNDPRTPLVRSLPRASLCAQDEMPPCRYVSVEGPVVAVVPANREQDYWPLILRYLPEMWAQGYLRYTWPEGKDLSKTMLFAHLRPEVWHAVNYYDDYVAFLGGRRSQDEE
ncbi:MAG: pyridoxamine 5'-phosphate oxidase family protein [Chloroflexi bacterium]|nr:pyridoxamine 5'-phosphate oxidase family protein [Chloroflexota bacterium]